MKRTILSLAVTAFMAGSIFTGCQWIDKKSETTKDNLVAAKNNIVETGKALNQSKNEAIVKLKKEYDERISSNEKMIAGFKVELAKEKEENRSAYEKKLAVLEQKNSEMKMKLSEFKEEGNDSWDTFNKEFSHDMDELGKALGDLTVTNVKKSEK